jgi:hypothetical protein
MGLEFYIGSEGSTSEAFLHSFLDGTANLGFRRHLEHLTALCSSAPGTLFGAEQDELIRIGDNERWRSWPALFPVGRPKLPAAPAGPCHSRSARWIPPRKPAWRGFRPGPWRSLQNFRPVIELKRLQPVGPRLRQPWRPVQVFAEMAGTNSQGDAHLAPCVCGAIESSDLPDRSRKTW